MAAPSSSRPRGTIAEVKQMQQLPTVPARSAPYSEVECFLNKVLPDQGTDEQD